MNEISHYPNISDSFKAELESNLSELGDFIVDFQPCGTVDLARGLHIISERNEIEPDVFGIEPEFVRGLFIDILGCVYSNDKKRGKLIICEVKKNKLTLTDHAQLIGYCIASKINYGILISIDGRITGGFENILKCSPHLVDIGTKNTTYKIGIGMWNNKNKEYMFDNLGHFKSFIDLSRFIATELM